MTASPNSVVSGPTCQACGGVMEKKQRHGNVMHSVSSIGFILGGLLLTLTCVGAIIGIPAIIIGGVMAKKPERVWRCRRCKTYIPRG